MRIATLGVTAAGFVTACSSLYAQAPDSIGDMIYYERRAYVTARWEETTVFRGDGTYQMLALRENGGIVATFLGYQPIEASTYTYTKTGENRATIASASTGPFRNDTGNVVRELTFSSPTSGTVSFVGPFEVNSGAFYEGNFELASYSAEPQVANLSTRGLATRTKPMIAGFIVSPGPSRGVLVRAIGPGLAAFGVENPASDPVLQIHPGLWSPSGTTFNEDTNDDWDASNGTVLVNRRASMQALFTVTGAFQLEEDSKDAATYFRLDPGSYTVHVVPKEGTADGEVLVEVYVLP